MCLPAGNCRRMGKGMETNDMAAEKAPSASDNPAVDQDALSLDALAKGVVAREFRPRAGSVRRLAEGVLALRAELKAERKKATKTAKSAGGGAAKSGNRKKKNKKLAKIPGQKKDR